MGSFISSEQVRKIIEINSDLLGTMVALSGSGSLQSNADCTN